MTTVEVVFLTEPKIGMRADVVLRGQQVSTSPVSSLTTEPGPPVRYHIETSSGSSYCGIMSASATQQGSTVYAAPPTYQTVGPTLDSLLSGVLPSGGPVPTEIRVGLNWGAFLLAPFWSGAHQVWIGLASLVPALGWPMAIILLFKGNEWGWKSREFRSIAHFRAVQRAWLVWGIVVYSAWVVIVLAYFALMFFLVSANHVSADWPSESTNAPPDAVSGDGPSASTNAPKVKVSVGSWGESYQIGKDSVYRPSDGKKFIVARVTVTNTSNERLSVSANRWLSSSDFELTGSDRNVYRAASFSDSTDSMDLLSADMLPQGSATGNVVFEVDRSVQPVSVDYRLGF